MAATVSGRCASASIRSMAAADRRGGAPQPVDHGGALRMIDDHQHSPDQAVDERKPDHGVSQYPRAHQQLIAELTQPCRSISGRTRR